MSDRFGHDSVASHSWSDDEWAAYEQGVLAASEKCDAEVAAAVSGCRRDQQERAERMEATLQSFADHGLSCDLTPTINCATAATTYEHFRSYLVRLDDIVRRQVRAALAGEVKPE